MKFRTVDIQKLNSMTKYPSIPTYHELGERGKLIESHINFGTNTIIATEKVDGTNTRLIVSGNSNPSQVIIGSREDLLHCTGDLIYNPSLGIVDAVLPIANKLASLDHEMMVFYGETYGGNIQNARNYTGSKKVGFRLFDVAVYTKQQIDSLFEMEPSQIALWRENGGQTFVSESILIELANEFELQTTPRITTFTQLPESIQGMYELLSNYMPETQCALDTEASRKPEGLVLRSTDRKLIAKARFDDYRRTLGIK